MFEELKEEREKFAAKIQSLQRARHESLVRSFYSLQPQKSQSLSRLYSQTIEPVLCSKSGDETRATNQVDLLAESITDPEKIYGEKLDSIANITNVSQDKASSTVPPATTADNSSETYCSPTTYNVIRSGYQLCDSDSSFGNYNTIDVLNHLAVHSQATNEERDEEVSIPAAVHTPVTRHTETVAHRVNVTKNAVSANKIDYRQAGTHTPSRDPSTQSHKQANKGTMTHSLCLKSVAIQVHSQPPKASDHRQDVKKKLTVSAFVHPIRKQPKIEYHPGAISSLVHPAYSSSVLQSYTEIYKSLSNTSKAILSS
ncbi:hypothetical protein GL50803_008123 [Giardia duodenalis]|uniref:Uncharacterized protein n=1 Tax=Giardia intestinalis (strain ATCC 50803 / WB clone C6) TaxID=184922 RepID=D3KHL9_GIAIC|nr:hypothetical protein GL50803_008123 [Giardia intestinalis]KAE8305584.1 hypothetical protein GL50803_008123 [Giardia intestinalis]